MKKIMVLLLAVVFSACQTKETKDPNAEKVNEMFAAFNAHDWNAMTALYAIDASFLDPSLGKEYITQTREQTAAK